MPAQSGRGPQAIPMAFDFAPAERLLTRCTNALSDVEVFASPKK